MWKSLSLEVTVESLKTAISIVFMSSVTMHATLLSYKINPADDCVGVGVGAEVGVAVTIGVGFGVEITDGARVDITAGVTDGGVGVTIAGRVAVDVGVGVVGCRVAGQSLK